MIRLVPGSSIRAVLGGAVSTAQPEATVSYTDSGSSAQGYYFSSEKQTALNGVNEVTICEEPSALTRRAVDTICIRNTDTASVTVTVRAVFSSANYTIAKVTLATMEKLHFSNVVGWYVTTAAGRMKHGIGSSSIPWETPGAIGSTTPNSGAFTTLSASGQITSTVTTGTAPMVIASTTKVANLNADLFDGSDSSVFALLASPAFTGTPTAPTASAGDNSTQIATTAFVASALRNKNLLINGCFRINQRAPATNADDTYAHDRWYALTQTGTIAVTTRSDAENGTPYMARLTQSQAVAQRMGYAQIIEGKNCRHLRGQKVSLKFRTALSSSDNIRFAILEWTGTEDTVTSDVVNSWTSGTYTASNFFLASNLTITSVTQKVLTAATLADASVAGVTLGSSFTNLIVFVWTENAVAQNVTLDLGKVQLEPGPCATEFEARQITDELALAQRYYCITSSGFRCYTGDGYVGTNFVFPVTMRAVPTGSFVAQGNSNFTNVPASGGFLSTTVYSGPYQYSAQTAGATYYDYGATSKFEIEL